MTVDPRPPDGHATGRLGAGALVGLAVAGTLVLVVVFAAGLLIGRGMPAAPTVSPGPTTAVVPTPGASPDPIGTASPPAPSDSPTPTDDPTPDPGPTGPPPPPPSTPPEAPADFGLFWEALSILQDRYVDPDAITDDAVTYGAIRGMVEALGDTGHTVFLTPEEVAAEQESLDGTVTGIGAFVDDRGGLPVIVSVVPDGPADRAGIQPGDTILAVDGVRTDRLEGGSVIRRVRGEAGTSVTLRVEHRDGTTEEIEIVRERIRIPATASGFVPDSSIGHVQLVSFSSGSGEALRDAVAGLLDGGAESIVLDLRGNPGGLVNEAVAAAGLFLEEGSVVYLREDRSGTTTPVTVEGEPIAPDVPMVVLVDAGSASSAEILSGALQDGERATVVGVPTFGTGTVLNTITLSDGSAVRVGVERWRTPDGRLIFDSGIEPDLVVELPAEGLPIRPGDLEDLDRAGLEASGDTQLLRAIELLEG